MLTIFATLKPFRDSAALIQRNAILSWTRLKPRPEVMLIGNEAGVAEFAREHSLRHVPEMERNAYGTPLVSSIFAQAERHAEGDRLAYVNADIILLNDF